MPHRMDFDISVKASTQKLCVLQTGMMYIL